MGKKSKKSKHVEPADLKEAMKLSEEQQKILENFREKAGKHLDQVYSDEDLLKFLRSKKWDDKKALSVLKSYHEWKQKTGPLTIERVRAVLEEEIIIFPGSRDRDGYFILYMRPPRYFPDKLPTPQLMEAVVYNLERVIEQDHAQIHGFTFIADMKDWGWANFQTEYARTFMTTMENRFPARLRKFILIDPPSWFNLVWVIIRPMFSAKFASKWHFLTRETIDQQVDDANRFPDIHGSHDFSMKDFISKRYEIEGIEYSDNYLNMAPSASGSIFAEKAPVE